MAIGLRFIRTKGIVGKAIRIYTFSSWDHVDIITKDGLLGARQDGVKIRPFDYSANKIKEFAVGVIETTLEQELDILNFAYSKIGDKYDWANIAGLVLHEDWFHTNKWICSQLAFASVLAGGIKLLDIATTDRVSPEMLSVSPLMKFTVYAGNDIELGLKAIEDIKDACIKQ